MCKIEKMKMEKEKRRLFLYSDDLKVLKKLAKCKK